MTMRKYMVYLDDGRDVFKCAVPAVDEEAAVQYVSGNGEVIAVKDVTGIFPISAEKVGQALENAGFGSMEMDFVTRALQRISICDMD